MTLYDFVDKSVLDEASGDMSTKILKTAEKVMEIRLFKRTLPSQVDGKFLLQAKNVLETICNEKAKLLETLSQSLRDISVTTQPVDLGNTMMEIFNRDHPIGNIQNPQPTNNILDVIQRRATATVATGGQPNPAHPAPPNPAGMPAGNPANMNNAPTTNLPNPPSIPPRAGNPNPTPARNTAKGRRGGGNPMFPTNDDEDEDAPWDNKFEDHNIH